MRISPLLGRMLARQFYEGEPGNGGGGPAPTVPVVPPVQRESFSREYVSEVREEAKTWRQKAQAHEASIAEMTGKLTAADQAVKDAQTTAQKAADDRVLRAELKAVALKHGVVDMDALKLLDLSKVKLLENGDLEGADELFEAAKKAKPYLFAAPTVGTTLKSPVPKNGEPADVRKLTSVEYAAAKKEATRRK